MQAKHSFLASGLLIIFSGLNQSCKYDNLEELQIATQCDSIAVSYQMDVVPILNSNCYKCHGASVYPFLGSGVRLEGYSSVKVYADNGQLVCSIERTGCANAEPMPQGADKLADSLITTIGNWVCKGAPDN